MHSSCLSQILILVSYEITSCLLCLVIEAREADIKLIRVVLDNEINFARYMI